MFDDGCVNLNQIVYPQLIIILTLSFLLLRFNIQLQNSEYIVTPSMFCYESVSIGFLVTRKNVKRFSCFFFALLNDIKALLVPSWLFLNNDTKSIVVLESFENYIFSGHIVSLKCPKHKIFFLLTLRVEGDYKPDNYYTKDRTL